MTHVELAHTVCEGWSKVSLDVLLRSAVKCGMARWFDFPLADQERASLRNVKIVPIIADLVSLEEALPIFGELPVLDPGL